MSDRNVYWLDQKEVGKKRQRLVVEDVIGALQWWYVCIGSGKMLLLLCCAMVGSRWLVGWCGIVEESFNSFPQSNTTTLYFNCRLSSAHHADLEVASY